MIKKTESFIVYHGINGLHDTYDTFRYVTITLVILWKKETLHQFSLKTLKWHLKKISCVEICYSRNLEYSRKVACLYIK